VSIELTSTQFILQKTEQKVCELDSLILVYKEKVLTFESEVATQNQKFSICANRIDSLEKDVITLTKKNKRMKQWLGGMGGGLVATLLIIITKK